MDEQELIPANKAERLALAAAVAPSLRQNADAAKLRRVARVDADGNVVGYTTLDEVQKALLRRHQIEIEVQPGVRPKALICELCGLPYSVKETRGQALLKKWCRRCRTSGRETCSGCDKPVPKHELWPSKVQKRAGRPWRCAACAGAGAGAGVRERSENCAHCGAKNDGAGKYCRSCIAPRPCLTCGAIVQSAAVRLRLMRGKQPDGECAQCSQRTKAVKAARRKAELRRLAVRRPKLPTRLRPCSCRNGRCAACRAARSKAAVSAETHVAA